MPPSLLVQTILADSLRVLPRLTVAMALCIAITVFAHTPRAWAADPQIGVYAVQLSGNVSGRPFQRNGQLIIAPTVTRVTTNGINPVEVYLGSGAPYTSPETGAIIFCTNSDCLGAPAQLDLASVSVAANGTIQVQPDSALKAAGINGFNESTGLTANLFQITSGTLAIQFLDDGRIVGAIDIIGTGAIFASPAEYQATITGTYTQPSPTVTTFTPSSGPVGTSVTIHGTNLSGATGVTFNGTRASFTVNSASQITATVPAGASTGKIGVTTPRGTAASTANFAVIAAPTVLLGDTNGDGLVDIRDYGIWRQNFGQQGAGNPADLDQNGIVDIRDYGIWRANFGHTAGDGRGGVESSAVWAGIGKVVQAIGITFPNEIMLQVTEVVE